MAERKTLADMEQFSKDSEARKRLISLFDEDTFVETDKFVSSDGNAVGVITGYGQVDGANVYAFAQDSSVMNGAVGKSVATKIMKIYELAVKNGSPVVALYDSNGGDVKEGISLLGAYGEIAAASGKLSGAVPQISVITGVCAGAAAMLACMADFVIMTEKSELFMTPPFIAADGKLSGAGSAKNAAESGVANIISKDDTAAIQAAKNLIKILPQNNLEMGGNDYYEENDADVSAFLKGEAMVKALADKNSVIELSSAYGTAAYTALASVNWRTVGFVATNKSDAKLSKNDSAKIARFVNLCDSFSIPVVTVVDTDGFEPSCEAELAGSIRDSAKLAQVYATATTPKISLVTGNAFGSAYIALASTSSANDISIAFDTAVIAPIAPKAAAIFLHGDEADSKEKLAGFEADYIANEASPFEAAGLGFIDRVIDPSEARGAIASALDICAGKRVSAPAKKHINFVF